MNVFAEAIHSRKILVDGVYLHYLEDGQGEPIVFLHGNPTSSFLWRNVIPRLARCGRCIAPDYLGMGKSDKVISSYRLVEHIRYVEHFLDELGLHNITFVAHDWGVVIALHLGRSDPQRVRAIAMMEGHIHAFDKWEDLDPGARSLFKDLRDPNRGRELILDQNIMIETVLPSGIVRTLLDTEMAAYRAPFGDSSSRMPMWRWVNEIPIAGEPSDVDAIVKANQAFLMSSPVPKLLLHADPGAVIGAPEVDWCRQHARNLKIVNVGRGIHFLPEDQPERIGKAIAEWFATL